MVDWEGLVVGATAGNIEAYGLIVRRFQDMAYGYAYSILGDFGLAEDAAQEAFVEAYSSLPNLREPAAFPGWLRKIVLKRCDRMLRRKRVATVPLESAAEIASCGPGPAEMAEQRELQQAVLAAIKALPRGERAVTALFYINGYSHDDIAGFLGVPQSTVKSRLHTARKRLKERMFDMVEDSLKGHALPSEFASRVLANIPPLKWGTHKECTFAGALESALAGTDHPYDYETIMGASGLAFRTRWFRDSRRRGWCPSSPVGEFPEEIEAVRRTTGWQLLLDIRRDESTGEFKLGVDEFLPRITASINAGKPVLAYGPELNMCVIHGYEDRGETLVMRDYGETEETVRRNPSELHSFLILLGEHSKPLSEREMLMQSLRMATANFRREPEPLPGKGHYLYGRAALDGWADDIGLHEELSEDERGSLFFVSWWCCASLADARVAAARFLKPRTALLGRKAHSALERAAGLYGQEVAVLGPVFETRDAFLGPWSGKAIADWSAEARERERGILTRAREIETAAISEIEKTLV
jgi:RNA polymerase sigma factor (sigma-70 family)